MLIYVFLLIVSLGLGCQDGPNKAPPSSEDTPTDTNYCQQFLVDSEYLATKKRLPTGKFSSDLAAAILVFAGRTDERNLSCLSLE